MTSDHDSHDTASCGLPFDWGSVTLLTTEVSVSNMFKHKAKLGRTVDKPGPKGKGALTTEQRAIIKEFGKYAKLGASVVETADHLHELNKLTRIK
jgi:hypothetical protein